MQSIGAITEIEVYLFGFALLFIFIVIVIAFFFASQARRKATSNSPYTGLPLRRASDLPYESARAILQFIYDQQTYDNQIFDIKKAALCRETGRIFPNSVTWLDTIHVDWTFLNKRHPGKYVSWGSLTLEQQYAIKKMHDSLEHFQTEYSCPKPAPSAITEEYAYRKPGPLYVDIDTKTLLGWQNVPDTPFEVMIVQTAKKQH